MSVHDCTFGKTRDEPSFKKLCAEIENDTMGLFFGTKTDAPKLSCESKLRKMISKGEKFANEIRNTIIQFAEDAAVASQPVEDDHPALSHQSSPVGDNLRMHRPPV
eukprot:6006829-Prymnesium_polylepis.1